MLLVVSAAASTVSCDLHVSLSLLPCVAIVTSLCNSTPGVGHDHALADDAGHRKRPDRDDAELRSSFQNSHPVLLMMCHLIALPREATSLRRGVSYCKSLARCRDLLTHAAFLPFAGKTCHAASRLLSGLMHEQLRVLLVRLNVEAGEHYIGSLLPAQAHDAT